jgi:hypothetical protein
VNEVYKNTERIGKKILMSCEKIPKKRRKCHPSGRKVLGRPIKRWRACLVITATDFSRPHTG